MPMAFRGLGKPTDQLDISIAPAEAQGTFAPMPAPAPQAQSGGFFGEGGTGRAIAGYLGDALAQMGGVQPVYAQALAAKREENQYQRQLADRWGLWKQQQEWERAHPAPTHPHYWETNDGSLGAVGPDGKPTILYKDPTPKVDWITVNNPDGTKTIVPKPQGGGVSPTPSVPTPGTIDGGYRFKGGDPSNQSNWEPVSGGGQGSATPGGFR